jgi:hypothetical protein
VSVESSFSLERVARLSVGILGTVLILLVAGGIFLSGEYLINRVVRQIETEAVGATHSASIP